MERPQISTAGPRLVVTAPGTARRVVPLEGGVATLGRGDDCAVVLDSPYVSRHHARIEHDRASWYVHDEGSSNGTMVNGRRISEPQLLRTGDEIRIWDIAIVFRDDTDDEPDFTLRVPVAADAPIRCDTSLRAVWLRDQQLDVRLSNQELELLAVLCARYGQVCTREELGSAIWGKGNFDFNMLHRLVHRLKQKLAPHAGDAVVSVPGVGYRLDVE